MVELVDTEKKNDGNRVGDPITAVSLVCLFCGFLLSQNGWLCVYFRLIRQSEKKTMAFLLTCSEKFLHRIYGNITKDGGGYITGGREEKVTDLSNTISSFCYCLFAMSMICFRLREHVQRKKIYLWPEKKQVSVVRMRCTNWVSRRLS